MKKNNKKGFTIVELVIVIAVIAILAAVLIPTFANLIDKANLSNDQQIVANMNKTMAIEFPGSKPEYAGDAIQKLYSAGYSKEKLVTYSKGYKYVYDLSDNKFYLADTNGNLVYPEKKTNKANVWGLYRDGGTNDKVNGVTNYVFLSSPTNHYNYVNAFSDGAAYVLDLNNGVLKFSTEYSKGDHIFANNDKNITLKNGTVLGGSYDVTEENGVQNSILADKDLCVYGDYKNAENNTSNMVAADGTLTFNSYSFVGNRNDTLEGETAYENLLSYINDGFDGELSGGYSVTPVTKLVFENCSFAEYKSFVPFGATTPKDENKNQEATKITEVVFTDCKFINAGVAIACNTKENKTVLKVTDCEFINCAAGVHIRDPKEGSVISNNTFSITGTDADMGQVVQFYKPATKSQTANEYLVLISNNKIEAAGSFVRVYANPSIASADWASFVKFENNNYPDDLTTVALSNNADEEHKTALEKLVA